MAQSGNSFPSGSSVEEVPRVESAQQRLADSLWLWQEHVDLQTDKTVLHPEEQLFFKANILTGPKQFRVSASEVLRVELLDGKGNAIQQQVHRISDGSSHGSLEIPKKTEPGVYYLRAYTQWMLNYGPDFLTTTEILVQDRSKNEFIPGSEKEIVLEPEGGFLVDDLETRVVIAIRNRDLKRKPVLNKKGEVVAQIEEYGRGLGTFRIRPVLGEQYSIRFSEDQEVSLPLVIPRGYSLQVNNLQSDRLIVQIEVSDSMVTIPVYLQGVSGGVTYMDQAIKFDKNFTSRIEIPKAELQEGIFELLLTDDQGQVWGRRPVLISKNELQIRAEKQLDPEGAEVLKLRVTDAEANPVETSMSLSLTGDKITGGDHGQAVLDVPNRELERGTAFVEDLRVLTGTRGKSAGIIKRSVLPENIGYSFQKGLDFYGQAYNLNNRLLGDTDIQILLEDGDKVLVREVRTNEDGRFQLTGLDISGEATLVFRTAGDEAETQLVKVIPYEYESPPLRIPDRIKRGTEKGISGPSVSEESLSSQATADDRLISLNTVTLTATRELQKSKVPEYAMQPTRVIGQEKDKPKPIEELFLNIPGIYVNGFGTPYPSLTIPRATGVGPLLWVLDGFLLDQSTTLVDIISLVPFTDVESIEVLFGVEATYYGSRAAGGVISIKTRSGSDLEYLDRQDAEAVLKGYHESVSFKEVSASDRKRKRSKATVITLFWDPELATDENGEVRIPLPDTGEFDHIRLEARVYTPDGKHGNIEVFFDKND